ncbi:hypothetical protein BGZ79_000462 [Entomortierella chlamydospora]|nr:hypothetical protein BGZ79_000462 [Entomortierella chlamydospora]
MPASINSPHFSPTYQPQGVTALLQQQRHHRRSIDRIWPPALEVKLAHWSRERAQNSEDENVNDDHRQNHCQQFRGHWTPDGRSTGSRSFIIPAPPPRERQDSGQYMSDFDYHHATGAGIADQDSNIDPEHYQQVRRTFSTGQLSNLAGAGYPKSNVTIQYKRHCKTPTPIYDGNNTSDSPYTFSTVPPTETFEPLNENQKSPKVNDKNKSKSTSNDANNQHHLYKTTIIDYTPDTLSEISTPSPIPSAPASVPSTTSRNLHLSRDSNTSSSPSVSRGTLSMTASSPETLTMLQDFLKQHSNGHIMHRRPINCPEICPDSSRSCSIPTGSGDNDNNDCSSGDDNTNEDDDKDSESALQSSIMITMVDVDQQNVDKLEDDRLLILGQSPEPSEFDPEEVFIIGKQKDAGKHVADTPVLFNGFPLLCMTPVPE